ncbi:MAG: hypothetical protein FWC85_03240 [Elusimicrobia bacterium]|nr:hypothetical protein [Elusimicrobiota bacterium]
MKINFKNMNLLDTASFVCGFLQENKIEVVLVGGACVSIYTDNKYLSNDFDLVCDTTLKEIEPVLLKIGYKRKGRLFVNENSDFVVDFVPPPVMVGQEHITRKETIKTKFGKLNLLTPTDCLKDRLAGFYFWQDPQSFEQALLIYKDQKKKVDLKDIEKWSNAQNAKDKFKLFIDKISPKVKK